MASDVRPAVPIALGSATGETEEGRAFFQTRLALFGGWVFLISGGFLVVNLIGLAGVAGLFEPSVGLGSQPFPLFHLAGSLVAGSIWVLCRRSPRPLRTLQGIDAGGTIVLCTCYGLMASRFALLHIEQQQDPLHGLFIGLLASSNVLIARAIAVPSSPRYTLLVSSASMVPVVVGYLQLYRSTPELAATTGLVDLTAWSVAAVAMAGIGSRVIFGLRAEVTKARRLGQYTLEEKIGEGGMGAVYRARHALLRRPLDGFGR